MQAKNDISDELRSLSALVAGISRLSPYKLPEGYFEGLPQLILDRIARLDGSGSLLASNLPKSLTFSVPEGYFDDFASRVLGRIKAGANLMPESMPDIFVGESVQEELARLSAVVSGISRENPFRLPEGYFEEVSPVLSILKDKTTYLAPEGYFEYLPAAVTEKTAHEAYEKVGAGAKVVAIGSRGKSVKGHWWTYAGAAAAACLILVFSWPQLHTSVTKTNEVQQVGQVQLAQNLSQSLHKVSDQEILNYLDDQNSNVAEPESNNTATLDMNDSDVKTLLGDIPDNELQQYMEEHGRANDIATN